MNAAIVIAIATLAGIIVLALGRRSRIGDVVGLGGLVTATLVATTIGQAPLVIGTDAIVETHYLRLFLVLGGTASTVLVLIGLLVGSPSTIAGVALLALAGAGMALAATDPVVAVLASTASAVAAAVVVADRRSGPRITVAARAFRATVVAGLLAFGGIVWLATAQGDPTIPGSLGGGVEPTGSAARIAIGPGIVGLAYLAVTLGMAVRLGAIPFHGWAARIAEATPPAGLPATLAIGPAALAVVVIAWLDGSVGTLGEPLQIERWLILVLGALSLIFGAVGAWLHDDVEHVVAYSLVQDAGVILLAAAALDPASWAPVRLWILSMIVVKSALAAWAAATRHAFGTRRVPELGGWARRSPLLAISFIVILVAIVGLPGLAAFDARAKLISIVVDGPFAAALLLAALAPLGYLGRILAIGLGPPSHLVREAPTARPSWPRPDAAENSTDEPRSGSSRRTALLALAAGITAAWRANRAPLAAALVLSLAALGFLTSAGGFGAMRAASESAPTGASTETIDLDGPGEPDAEPSATGDASSEPPSGSPAASGNAASDSPLGSEPPSSETGPATSAPAASAGTSAAPVPSAAPPGASPPPSFEPVPTASG